MARGLPKLSYVAVVGLDAGAEALHAFACALSEQRSTSAGCSADPPCLTLDVVSRGPHTHHIAALLLQHPGVEVRAVQFWGWKLPQDMLGG